MTVPLVTRGMLFGAPPPDIEPPIFAGIASASDEQTGREVGVSWAASPSPDVVGYDIYHSTETDFEAILAEGRKLTSPPGVTNIVVGGLQNLVERNFMVTARDANGNSDTRGNTAGIDSFTKLLLHCDGADGSTNFVDSSALQKPVTAVGNAQIVNDYPRFGSGACLIGGVWTDYLSVPDSSEWDITGDFTLDVWLRFDFNSYFNVGQRFGDNGWAWIVTAESVLFYAINMVDPFIIIFEYVSDIPVDEYHHFAVSRQGTEFRFFIDGQLIYSETITQSIDTYASILRVGGGVDDDLVFDGRFDEFRFTNGVARYVDSFVPNDNPYFNGGIVIIPATPSLSGIISAEVDLEIESQDVAIVENIEPELDVETDLE